jgi:2-C-methyl-D-erythritol 4-phosphate cytidylyltransferase
MHKGEIMVSRHNRERRVVAVILGAGQGTRVGGPVNKIFLPLDGKPLITYAIEAFEHCSAINEILLVGASGEEEQLAKLAHQAHCHKVKKVVQGGDTRHASEKQALEALRQEIETGKIEIVLVHDGARPFISVEKIRQLVEKAREVGGAILAEPLQEEERIAQVDEQKGIKQSFEGEQIWKAQTPQAFRASLLLKAYDQAEQDQFRGTDTAASLERMGYAVAIVKSDATNLKVTTPYDLLHAEKISRDRQFS